LVVPAQTEAVPAIVQLGVGFTVSVTAALLLQLFPLVTFAYTVAVALVYEFGVPIDVAKPTSLNQVTVTPLTPPVTVLLTEVKSKEAVVPFGVVEHLERLAVLATGN
jgi:hypothetical protein